MGGKTLVKNTLVFGIILLFIVSAVSPMVIGLKSDTVDVERGEFLDNLAFYYYDEYDSTKFEHYKEYLQRDNLEIADLEEITIPIESPQTSVSSGPMDSPWPMKSHDTHHTGRSPYSTADNHGDVKWKFQADGWIEPGSVIDNEGIIYFGCFDYYLYALYPNGTLKWKYKTGGWIWSTPAINVDGTIYIGTYDDFLYAINPNGTRKWRFLVHDSISSSPAIAEDGTIYFGTMGTGYNIYAVNPNGTEKWHYKTGYKIASDPAIGDDGTIYIGSGDSYLYAMNPNGTLKWRFKTGYEIHGHPSIADDGTIYIGSFDDYLYALNPNGTMKWKTDVGAAVDGGMAIGEDGIIYIGTDKLRAIYPNGTIRWSFDIGNDVWIYKSTPAISADGTIYFGTFIGGGSGGDIIAVNPDGTEKWRKRIAKWIESSPSIAEDGTVYIGTTEGVGKDGYLIAFGELDPNAPDAPTITGQTSGKAGKEYNYKFTTTDPNSDDVYYYIEWGDGAVENWIGPYSSGEEITLSHTWKEEGTYTIRARAKDTDNLWGPWGYLEVTMPMNQQTNNWWFLQFLQNHPQMFPILRHILGL